MGYSGGGLYNLPGVAVGDTVTLMEIFTVTLLWTWLERENTSTGDHHFIRKFPSEIFNDHHTEDGWEIH